MNSVHIHLHLCCLTDSDANTNQVDLFGQRLVRDLLDAPTSVPEETSTMYSNSSKVDLFADAAFVSASPHVEAGGRSENQIRYCF